MRRPARQAFAGWFLTLGLLLVSVGPSFATRPDEMLSDPALEARAEAISRDIRCVVCQSQSIEESDADVAHDLRVLIREQLKAGASDAEVKAFLVARYGDFILLQPPFKLKTALIWIGPFALLFGAAAAVFLFYRRAGRPAASPLNAAEQARLDAFMKSHDDMPGGAA
jgi:cytochrome c-type biogenesis protein CcmH